MACIKRNFIVSHRQHACDIPKTFCTELVSTFIISPYNISYALLECRISCLHQKEELLSTHSCTHGIWASRLSEYHLNESLTFFESVLFRQSEDYMRQHSCRSNLIC